MADADLRGDPKQEVGDHAGIKTIDSKKKSFERFVGIDEFDWSFRPVFVHLLFLIIILNEGFNQHFNFNSSFS